MKKVNFREKLILSDILLTGKDNYKILYSFYITNIEFEKIEENLNNILKQNECLRMKYIKINNDFYKEDIKYQYTNIEVKEFSSKEECMEFFKKSNFEVFDKLLLNTYFITINKKIYIFIETHHVLMDYISIENFISELIYEKNERKNIEKQQNKVSKDYINNHLIENIKNNTLMIYDNFNLGNRKIHFTLKKNKIKELMISERTSIFNLIITAYARALCSILNKDNISIGYTSDLRNTEKYGNYANQLILNYQKQKDFLEDLRGNQLQILSNMIYGNIQFEEYLNNYRNNKNPYVYNYPFLFGISYTGNTTIKNKLEIVDYSYYLNDNKYPLNILVSEYEKELNLTLEYDNKYFNKYFCEKVMMSMNENFNTDIEVYNKEKYDLCTNLKLNEIKKIFCKLLKVDEVEDDIDFFSLGGDSLKLLQLTNEINKTYTVEISLPDLFRNSTPKRIEKLLKNKMKESFNTKKITLVFLILKKKIKTVYFFFIQLVEKIIDINI
ncbi:hypothetical protein M2680_001935 [Staphylococcus pseudintermedius]|nr:hypothetical protein [Staphylococcus pseudintermedius]